MSEFCGGFLEAGGVGLRDFVRFVTGALQGRLTVGELHDLLFVRGALRLGFGIHGLHLIGKEAHGLFGGLRIAGLKDGVDDRQGSRCSLFPGGELFFVFAHRIRSGQQLVLGPGDVVQEGLQPVEVLLQNRIKFVIVALGALHAEAHEDVGGDTGGFIENELPLPFGIALIVFIDAMAEEGGGNGDLRIFRVQFVAGDLLTDELVIGLVSVEGLDDVVAVRPDIGAVGILAVTFGLGITGKVQPVLSPAFAIMGRRQEVVDQSFVNPIALGGVWGGLISGDELPESFRGRWQAMEVKGDAPDDFLRRGLRRGCQAFFGKSLADEEVDLV